MRKNKTNIPEPQTPHIEFDSKLLDNEIWLTTQEAMEYLNVSRSTIYRLRRQCHIPNFKLGHSPMYPKHLLNKILLRRSIRNVKEY